MENSARAEPRPAPRSSVSGTLSVRGAREHNLRGVDLDLPHGLLVGFAGVSGSGKSSLVFDTIYREGQRRFLECLSPHARAVLGPLERPAARSISGLPPSIAVDQRPAGRSVRSTVGTITEVQDHLRLLFARLGVPHCPSCGREVVPQSASRIVDRILEAASGRSVLLLAPIVRGRRGELRGELEGLRRRGFVRARIDGEVVRLDETAPLERRRRHTIEAVVDRLTPGPEKRDRLLEAVESGLAAGRGTVVLSADGTETVFSSARSCPECGIDLPEIEPRLFSFNSPHGACPACAGTGEAWAFDAAALAGRERLSLERLALGAAEPAAAEDPPFDESLLLRAREAGVPVDRPLRALDARAKEKLARLLAETPDLPAGWGHAAPCAACGGTRLHPIARAVTFHDRRLGDLCAEPIVDASRFFEGLSLSEREAAVGRDLFRELADRLGFLVGVGVGYLSLDRSATTLSGGELQRVRLASQIGSGLSGVVYVLDEPSIGLHPKDVGRLVASLRRLRDRGNTVLVVEHDEATLRACDLLVEIGPGAGAEGGKIVATGSPADLARIPDSPTGAFLRGEGAVAPRAARRQPVGFLVVRNARGHNLKGVDARFPLGCLVAVSGVSGSGKSTLVDLTLRRALRRRLHGSDEVPAAHDGLEGAEGIRAVVDVDATPIGRTPRSNPATYTGVFEAIRALFAALPEARVRGYEPGRFSFNVAGGRCEACGGAGARELRLEFLATVTAPCPECEGRRFNEETLAVRLKGRSIADVLAMTVGEARAFFDAHPRIRGPLAALEEVGLGYLRLGQPSTQLSGGEAQRVKLAAELGRRGGEATLYLLDEPTTGLHERDVARLLGALHRLVDAGHTVVVVEHHPDVILSADFVLDLGPGSGEDGGRLVADGTPEEVAARPGSATGEVLASILAGRRTAPPAPDGPPAAASPPPAIRIVGARANNLRDLTVDIPRGKLVVLTGPSGSGKSSLALDTLFAEGRRRFVESLSAYARRFLGRLERAPVDRVEGLGPAVAVDARGLSSNRRSTVGTASEVADFLRVAFARAGTPHCPGCVEPLLAWSTSAIAETASRDFDGKRGRVLAPLAADEGGSEGSFRARFERLAREGFARVLVDGEERRLDDKDARPPSSGRRVELVVDRVVFGPASRARVAEAVEQAGRFGAGTVVLEAEDGGERRSFSTHGGCARCGFRLTEPLSPRHFSFNLRAGACPACEGLGERVACDPAKLIAAPDLPFLEGALVPPVARALARDDGAFAALARAAARAHGIDLSVPFADLPERARERLLRGTGERRYAVEIQRETSRRTEPLRLRGTWPGVVGVVERWVRTGASPSLVSLFRETSSVVRCEACKGGRLRAEALAVRLAGRTLPEVLSLPIAEAREFLGSVALEEPGASCWREVGPELLRRLETIEGLDLGYLALDRPTATLSSGEGRRLRLASMLGAGLVGVVFVLDEPTVGLHPDDSDRLVAALRRLRDQGNTVVVVEHDESVVRAADHVIDLGPGAGAAGGRIVAQGTPREIAACPDSPTGRALRREVELPLSRARTAERPRIRVVGARARNLRGVSFEVPLGRLVGVCGPSGAGKSSLVFEALLPALGAAGVAGAPRPAGPPAWDRIEGASFLDRAIALDASPIGRTPHSNPATYTGVFDEIRDLFARTPDARARGYPPARFSPFAPGGRCETCQGRGAVRVRMDFLADAWLPCDECGGRRFREDTLAVRLRGRTIADVLEFEVDEAREFFAHSPAIRPVLDALHALGLGYLRLGQSSATLSGGEAQRVRLASILAGAVGRPEVGEGEEALPDAPIPGRPGRRLFVLDEPTVGLHLAEVARLFEGLQRLVDLGDTVLFVEHHPGVLACADRLVEVGPGAGAEGGRIVAEGTPEQLAASPASLTGRTLRGWIGAAAREGLRA